MARRPGKTREPAPTTPDPVEIAMEMAVSGTSPGAAALEVLQTNAALMREQIGLARNERFRNRIRAIRDIALAAVVVALLVLGGTAVWSASRTTGLVIQPFSVPPELVENGLDGRAVAALFLDELVRLEAATESARPPASFRNDWSEAITVEVEAGGLSLTDAYTSLTRWLGKETYVSGGLRQTTAGLELVVRSSDGTAVTVQGPADQPEALMRQAAERVYEQTQPYRYAIYVSSGADAQSVGPEQQALLVRSRAILTRLLDSPSPTERVWAYNGLSRQRDTSLQESIPVLLAALEIDPEHPNILVNLTDDSRNLGHDEASLGYAQRLVASLRNPRNRIKVAEDRQQRYPLISAARVAELQGDRLQALELYTRLLNIDLPGASNFGPARVGVLIALHQPSAIQSLIEADELRARGRPDPANPRLGLRALAAADLDQWPEALAFLEAAEADRPPTLYLRQSETISTSISPRLAYARARTGDLAGARALIAATPLDCYLCVRERARIAELAGDRAAADRWSAEARRQGPSLPFAFAERGQMLMARGDPAGAIRFFEEAIERGPRWADPQKFWGDALMAQGDEAGAIRKYRAAAERAPQWGALHLAWGRALWAQGRRDQARERWRAAAGMDLSAADRAEVARRLGSRTRT
ncbi:tetratricopeptide repeat protein [Brevundimonas sp.]|uniref:tetratricopeptide repeat protein n=1 Tax=Brevundimonas sp. TaxID=1871086 RepID=UPI00260A7AEF|nr:tetratricopeptide repeat protein [Brevundimonas sp.]